MVFQEFLLNIPVDGTRATFIAQGFNERIFITTANRTIAFCYRARAIRVQFATQDREFGVSSREN